LAALGATLAWGLGYAVYLNRIGSRGLASTRRLLRSALQVFAIALPLAFLGQEAGTLWILTKSSLGYAESQYQTGVIYLAGNTFLRGSQAKACRAFRFAAQQGHAQAQFALAHAYHYGRGITRDEVEALRWAKASARSGQPQALVLAGDILQDTTPDEAESYYRQAVPLLRGQADQGDGEASFALGYLYRNGRGVVQDPVEALTWMLIAQRSGISPLQGFATQAYQKSLPADQQALAQSRAEAWRRSHGGRG
jgi:hypothetical protein